ncbi:MAG: tRNA pseudouridine(13) synthase TruD [Thiohalomonadales bacterium]
MINPNFQQMASQWAYAYERPEISGQIRSTAEDFIVVEKLSFEPSGEGEHVYLYIQKRELNTLDVVHLLANLSGVKNNRISYAGLKDKRAVTTQWFSVLITGFPEPDWKLLESDKIKVTNIVRHNKKLRRGAIRCNQFSITLRDVNGDLQLLEERLVNIEQQGLPNYFGEQRFGHHYHNLEMVQQLALGQKKEKNRHKRSLYYSAARSFLFNQVLSQRVSQANWNTAINGDVMSLDGSRSFFKPEQNTAEIMERVKSKDLHPSGPLVGAGESQALHDALIIEQQCLQEFLHWEKWLATEHIDVNRRALRTLPKAMQWQWSNDNRLQVRFELPSGTYATSVLREILSYKSC